MKKLSLVLILVIVSLICFGCEMQYDGKQIDTITYDTVDYMGGYRKSTVFDLKNNQILQKSYGYKEEKEYEVIYTFDDESEKKFINELYSCGFLDLEEEYTTDELVYDGGEWSLSIGYFDETKKVSRGINALPYEIFKKAGYAFYNLYGVDLFNILPTNYKEPEGLGLGLTFEYENGQGAYSGFAGAYKYQWNKSSRDIDIFNEKNKLYVVEFFLTSPYNENYPYSFSIGTANSTLKFKKYKLYNYDLNGENEKLIDEGRFFKRKEWPAEMNKIYVVRCEFDYGVAYYAASTKIYNQE